MLKIFYTYDPVEYCKNNYHISTYQGALPGVPLRLHSFDSRPRVGKQLKRISLNGFSFGSQSHFTGILAYSTIYTNKSNDDTSGQNTVIRFVDVYCAIG